MVYDMNRDSDANTEPRHTMGSAKVMVPDDEEDGVVNPMEELRSGEPSACVLMNLRALSGGVLSTAPAVRIVGVVGRTCCGPTSILQAFPSYRWLCWFPERVIVKSAVPPLIFIPSVVARIAPQ